MPSRPFNLTASGPRGVRAWEYTMTGHAEQCVQKYLELAQVPVTSLKPVATPSLDDHQLSPEDFETKGHLDKTAARIVLKALYLARMNRAEIIWAVNSLAREVTRWNKACDKRLHRLIAYMKSTKYWKMEIWIGDKFEDC